MKRYRNFFAEAAAKIHNDAEIKKEEAKEAALARIIRSAVLEINAMSADAARPERYSYTDGMLEAALKAFGRPDADGKVFLDIAMMKKEPCFRGQFEERIFPILEGLYERAGVLNGRKIQLVIDSTALETKTSKPSQPMHP